VITELTSTRANPLVDPSLHVWGWEIPVYLFLGGLVAGMMILSGHALLTGRGRRSDCVCYLLPGLGLVLLSLGMLALFLDLEHQLFVWRLYTTFMPLSPMSWGAWILLLVYPALIANLLLRPPELLRRTLPALARTVEALGARPGPTGLVGGLNVGLGVLLGIYTGVLLSTMGARPLWNSALLGPLFLASGLSGAAALVHMVAREADERTRLARVDNAALAVELVLLGLFLVGLATATRVHAEAVALLCGGPFTALFWVGVVGLGIVVPLIVQSLAVRHRVVHTPVPPLLVIAGGLLLRFVIVYAGQLSRWTAL
jgi:protein NrfD